MPGPWSWPNEDAWLKDTHWAYDLGAADLVRELASALRAPTVMSDFTRLLADPNRPPHDAEIFRQVADGKPIGFNQNIDDEERARRFNELYDAYHEAFDKAVRDGQANLCFSVHTFTPVYEGERRELEIGILFDRDEPQARELADAFDRGGFTVALNEPYSGRHGLIYSVEQHALRHDRRCLEIEVRSDLALAQAVRDRIVDILGSKLPALAL